MKTSIFNAISNEINNAVTNYKMTEGTADTLRDFLSDRRDEIDETTDADKLRDIFDEWNTTQEVIYYYNAWEVIKKFVETRNDFDFGDIRTALAEYGYESIDGLGSELIATVLTQWENNEFIGELCDLIDTAEIYEDTDEDDDETAED